jgi:hypothetical protein
MNKQQANEHRLATLLKYRNHVHSMRDLGWQCAEWAVYLISTEPPILWSKPFLQLQ